MKSKLRTTRSTTIGSRATRSTWLTAVVAALTLGAGSAHADAYEATRWVMGTYLRIEIPLTAAFDSSPNAPKLEDILGQAGAATSLAFDEVQRWEALLSNYDSKSPLSRLGDAAPEWMTVPKDLYTYLEQSRDAFGLTGETFDITIASDPTVRGMDGLELRSSGPTHEARLTRAGMRLDPGGNGKGWALDAAVRVLRNAGVESAYLDFGGSSFYGLGKAAKADSWQVRFPASGDDAYVFQLADAALSSSAALRADEDAPDDRTAHIVDPATGQLVETDREVAVMASSATDAEVLSTALVVAGSNGFAWLSHFHAAQAVVREPSGDLVFSSPLAPFSWLVGTWERTVGDTHFYERWHSAANGVMHGEGGVLDENGNPAQALEQIALLDMGDGVHYVAYPVQNDVPVAFPLVDFADNRWTFENVAHDFPQRIAYVKDGADRMRVIVTGPDDDGQKKVLFFPFKRGASTQNKSN